MAAHRFTMYIFDIDEQDETKTHPLTIAQVRTPSFPMKLLLGVLNESVTFGAVVFIAQLLNKSLTEALLVSLLRLAGRLGRRV